MNMNKHLQKLAEQAGFYVEMFDPDNAENAKIERFAELLIKRSTDLIAMHANQLRQFNFELNAKTADAAAGILLEHFGFKETKGWICPKCGIDRTKEVCPKGHMAATTGECPMIGVAQ